MARVSGLCSLKLIFSTSAGVKSSSSLVRLWRILVSILRWARWSSGLVCGVVPGRFHQDFTATPRKTPGPPKIDMTKLAQQQQLARRIAHESSKRPL